MTYPPPDRQPDSRPPHEPHPDVDALLQRLPAAEAAGLRAVWDLAGPRDPFPAPSAPDVEQALHDFVARADITTPSRWNGRANPSRGIPPAPRHRATDRAAQKRASRPTQRPAWTALAASLLVAALGVAWWAQPITQVARPGDRLAVELPDGSHVELNSGSQLRYARRFGDVRRVHLLGEAFFDVAEAARPFRVETFNAQVEVLGTRFGVRAWPDGLDDGTTVALETGRVALAPAGQPDRAVILQPGETRRVAERGGRDLPDSSAVSVEDATAWRRGDLVYRDQLLGVILDDVERRFDVAIQVQPERLSRTRVGMALRRPADAESVVRDLSLALGLQYRETRSGFELFAPPPDGLSP